MNFEFVNALLYVFCVSLSLFKGANGMYVELFSVVVVVDVTVLESLNVVVTNGITSVVCVE